MKTLSTICVILGLAACVCVCHGREEGEFERKWENTTIGVPKAGTRGLGIRQLNMRFGTGGGGYPGMPIACYHCNLLYGSAGYYPSQGTEEQASDCYEPGSETGTVCYAGFDACCSEDECIKLKCRKKVKTPCRRACSDSKSCCAGDVCTRRRDARGAVYTCMPQECTKDSDCPGKGAYLGDLKCIRNMCQTACIADNAECGGLLEDERGCCGRGGTCKRYTNKGYCESKRCIEYGRQCQKGVECCDVKCEKGLCGGCIGLGQGFAIHCKRNSDCCKGLECTMKGNFKGHCHIPKRKDCKGLADTCFFGKGCCPGLKCEAGSTWTFGTCYHA